jgi:hypothetical protein
MANPDQFKPSLGSSARALTTSVGPWRSWSNAEILALSLEIQQLAGLAADISAKRIEPLEDRSMEKQSR